jgi:Fic family protein
MAAQDKIAREIKVLVDLLGRYPDGLGIEQILAQAGLGLPRRTLKRRLESPEFAMDGKGRATVYKLKTGATPQPPGPSAVVTGHDEADAVPLSEQAKGLRALVRRPLEARDPVGYRHAFLDGYRPNESFYLSADERQRLAKLGGTDGTNQPAGTHAQNILNRLLIDLSWNSSRLEGNTYSLLDTERLIAFGEAAEGKNATEAQMILNHKEAIEFLVEGAAEIDFDRQTILNLHAKLADNLLEDPHAVGRLRRIGVAITGSVFHPLGIPQQIDEYFNQVLTTARAIRDPFEQSFFAMAQLPYLQPFEDVNKRVSRLAANIPMIKKNLSPISFVGVSQRLYTDAMLAVYELNRVELLRDVFLWAYERSANRYAAIQQSTGQPDPFRFRYRPQLRLIVPDVIKRKLDKKAAAQFIAAWTAQEIAEADRARFVEMVETELLALHEGNFARYAVRPSEFADWYALWTVKPARASKALRKTKD